MADNTARKQLEARLFKLGNPPTRRSSQGLAGRTFRTSTRARGQDPASDDKERKQSRPAIGHQDFCEYYARACEDRPHTPAEEALEMAEDFSPVTTWAKKSFARRSVMGQRQSL
jgi:hypothetical protein